jgi:hypothetical protein
MARSAIVAKVTSVAPAQVTYETAKSDLLRQIAQNLLPALSNHESISAQICADFTAMFLRYVIDPEVRAGLELARRETKYNTEDLPQLFVADIFGENNKNVRSNATQAALDVERNRILAVIRYVEKAVNEKSFSFTGIPTATQVFSYIEDQGGVSDVVKKYNSVKQAEYYARKRAEKLERANQQRKLEEQTRRETEMAAAEAGLTVDEYMTQQERELAAAAAVELEQIFLQVAREVPCWSNGVLPDGIYISLNGVTYVVTKQERRDILSHGINLMKAVA